MKPRKHFEKQRKGFEVADELRKERERKRKTIRQSRRERRLDWRYILMEEEDNYLQER